MNFEITFDKDFDRLMHHLWSQYGGDLFSLDGIGEQLDLNKFAKNFFNNKTTTADVSIDANANISGKTVIDFNLEMGKPMKRYNSYYLLWKELKRLYGMAVANDIIEKQLTGDVYINDFSDVGMPYCFNFSCMDIITSGLNMSERMTIRPPKSLVSFIRQIEQFTVYAANSAQGATGLADFLVCSAKFIEEIGKTGVDGHIVVDNLVEFVLENFKSFIYTVNWEFRGNQSPFTNVSIYDDLFLESLCEDYGVKLGYVKLAQELFLQAIREELDRTALTFPVITSCHSVDEEGALLDKEFAKFIAKENLKYGHINMYYGDTATLSSCCRLRSKRDTEYHNSFGAGSTKIGSLGVVTINLPRLAVCSSSRFFTVLRDYVRDCARINNAKRHILKKRIELGALPLYSLGFMEISRQYSTVGITGLNEALEVLGYDILEEDGQKFVLSLLDVINSENDKLAKQYGAPHNCEQVPAESSSVTLAKKDAMLGVINKYPLYSNQFIPLTTGANLLDRIKIQGMFDKHFSGGAICHVNVNEQIKDPARLVELMEYAAKKGVVYWAVNYALKRCSENHTWVDGETCPVCGGVVADVVTRVVGFFTSVKNWNSVRREHDWPNRKFYNGV